MSNFFKGCLIGHPIGHTMSPFIHSRLFNLSETDFSYDKVDIAPENLKKEIKDIFTYDGFNITIPHKQSIIPFLTRLDASAKRYGAVNCVSVKDNEAVGYNTDAFGFLQALEAENIQIGDKVLICGSGGVARTFAVECAEAGAEISIASINNEAEYLKGEIKFNSLSYDQIEGEFDLIINATPVGMYPKVGLSVLKPEQIRARAVFDAVYNPRSTRFLEIAREKNIKALGGMSMLVWQAVKSHQYWYGAEFDTKDIIKLIGDTEEELTRLFEGK